MTDAAEKAPIFLVPSPELGRIEDVHPERLDASTNDWIAHTREVLRKKQAAARTGGFRPANEYVGEDADRVKPHTADACPAMEELSSVGYLLKWPASAIVRQVAPKAWQVKPSTNWNFFSYSPLTAFPEAGEAEAFLVETGWTVITPPGWSVILKNVPNQLVGAAAGITLAEAVVRTDRVTIPLQTHAFLQPGAPKEIFLKRGTPMAVLFPFKRAATELVVVDDVAIVDEVAKRAASEREAYASGSGVYRRLAISDDATPNPLYDRLLRRAASK